MFGDEIRSKKDIPDHQKKEVLLRILHNIIVNYDNQNKVHILTINFKIPVLIRDEGSSQTTRIEVKPPKSGRKQKEQTPTPSNYSTVVNYLSSEVQSEYTKSGSFRLSVELKSSFLWTPTYTIHQQELFDLTCLKHETEGLNFQQISEWFNDNNYITTRGKVFTQGHVWSIYKKKKKSNERFSRMFTPVITDIGIQVGG